MRSVFFSDSILAIFGIVFATLGMSVRTGDWMADFFGSSWLPLSDMGFEPHWLMFGLPIALSFVLFVLDAIVRPRREDYREELTATRQGVNGELPRLPLAYRVALCIFVGFTEEVAFRYGLLGFLIAVSQAFIPGVLSLAAAVIIAAGVFALMHAQYNGAWTLSIVFGIGIVFGGAWIYTDNLLVVIVAHALYDFIDMQIERHHMTHEPDYFEGKVPNYILVGMKGAGATPGTGTDANMGASANASAGTSANESPRIRIEESDATPDSVASAGAPDQQEDADDEA